MVNWQIPHEGGVASCASGPMLAKASALNARTSMVLSLSALISGATAAFGVGRTLKAEARRGGSTHPSGAHCHLSVSSKRVLASFASIRNSRLLLAQVSALALFCFSTLDEYKRTSGL